MTAASHLMHRFLSLHLLFDIGPIFWPRHRFVSSLTKMTWPFLLTDVENGYPNLARFSCN